MSEHMNYEEIKLCIFPSPKSYSSVLTPLKELMRLTRYDDMLSHRTRDYRERYAAMGKESAKVIKETMVYAFSVAVNFHGTGHTALQASYWTGLAMCDLDHIDEPDELEIAFERLTRDPHVIFMYRTISGRGLRVIYSYQRENGRKIDDTSWKAAFLFGNERLSQVAGHPYDEACKDYTRLSGMAFDPNTFFNPDAEPFTIPDDLIVEENCEHQEHGRPRKEYQPNTHEVTVETAWPKVEQMLKEKHIEYMAGQHHDYILHAAYLFNRYGVPLDELLQWAEQEWADHNGDERERAIRHKYKDTDKHGTWKLNKPAKGRENAMVTLPEIRQWLSERIVARYNLVTDQMLWRPKKSEVASQASDLDLQTSDAVWKQVDNILYNTLRGRIAADTSKRVLTQDVKSVVESDFAEQVHPVREYIQLLPSWDGVDRVAEVASHVHVKAALQKQSDDDAQQIFYQRLKQWLIGMVATWMNDKECNQEILTFIGDQGIYKTTFFRHILPPPLHAYFWENTHNSFSHKDDRIACAENCLVDIEEIEAIEGSDMEQLKGLVTSEFIKERRPYAIFREQKHRLCSFCATGNQQRILTDISGTRRWLCFLVDTIDNPREWNLNYEQLYAQLYQEYQQGFRYYLTKTEENHLNEANQPFRQISPEEELITCRLRKPVRNETPKRMSASMICQLLVGGPGKGLSVVKIGQVMRKKKFRSMIINGYELFLVIEVPFDKQQEYLSSEDFESSKESDDIFPTPVEQTLNFEPTDEDLPF